MSFGFGLAFPRYILAAKGFSPASLFSSGEQGAWYDPSDINLTWRRNLLTYTEQFNDSIWLKDAVTVTPDSVSAPNGATTADTLAGNGLSAIHSVRQGTSVAGTRTVSFYAKAGTNSFVQTFTDGTSNEFCNFDLSAGAVGSKGTDTGTATITPVGAGWYRCAATFPVNNSTTHIRICLVSSATAARAEANSLATDVYIWGAQLEVGSTASAYQQIVTPAISYLTYQPLPILYEDAAGITPVTGVELPVGLMLDKSKGLVLGSELVTNGDFSDGTTGWTANNSAVLSVNSGRLRVTNGGSLFGFGYCSFSTTVGVTYKVTAETFVGSTTPYLRCGTSSGGTQYANILTAGSKSFVFIATTTTTYLSINVDTNVVGAYVDADNISVRELPGNHAYQTIYADRPTLSARYNLLTKTEQFQDSYWTKTNCTISADTAATTDPLGGNTADKLVEASGASLTPRVQRFLTTVAGAHIFSFSAKAGERSWVRALVNSTALGSVSAYVNLADGSVGTVTAGTTVSVVSQGNGWYRITYAVTCFAEVTNFYAQSVLANNGGAYTGDGTSGIYIWGADLRPTNILGQPEYQRVNTATDYDTVGFSPYLRFNGTNSWMQTATITPGTDKAQVFAGVRKLSDAAGYSVLCETSVDVSANNGAIGVQAPRAITSYFSFRSRGTLLSDAQQTGATYAAPITAVLSGIGDIAADVATIRVNGSAGEITSTADQGTGNYLAYPLYIGRRGGSSVPFNGYVYSLVVRFGPNLTGSQIASTETWVNTKTGAF